MDLIRVGVIGCGGILRNQHAPYYDISERAKVVAVADVNEANAKAQAERFDEMP